MLIKVSKRPYPRHRERTEALDRSVQRTLNPGLSPSNCAIKIKIMDAARQFHQPNP